jgi:hypothetical protein
VGRTFRSRSLGTRIEDFARNYWDAVRQFVPVNDPGGSPLIGQWSWNGRLFAESGNSTFEAGTPFILKETSVSFSSSLSARICAILGT